jgi:hypothetical protein
MVVSLMLRQRLEANGSQQAVVGQLAAGQLDRLLPESKRAEAHKISLQTGGYCRACQRFSVSLFEQACDQLLGELRRLVKAPPELKVPMFVLDGTTLRVEHTSELLERFPCSRNQYGQQHWGILLLVGLHDVRTGIALRPAWGAMYGEHRVGEQALARQVIQSTPEESVILGDGNLGIFSFAYAVEKSKRKMIFRLTRQRAKAMMGATELQAGEEREYCWKPSKSDRRRNPALPLDAEIRGRLIVAAIPGLKEPLYLFATLEQDAAQIVALYGQRWNIELDFRALKQTMGLEHLRAKSPEAVEKELLIAIVAYGLVRANMALAARRSGLAPRQLSFTQCYRLFDDLLPQLYSPSLAIRDQAFDRMLTLMSTATLPQRKKKRSYPRATWRHPQSFPYYPSIPTQEMKSK